MKLHVRNGLVAAAALALTACASVSVTQYEYEKPALDLARYFNGTIDGWGTVQDRSGTVLKRFHVRIDAAWKGEDGTLDEHFEYADGTTQQRIWKVSRNGNRYTGTAADVIGTAQGAAAGNALHWNYVLETPVDGRLWNLDMDDWMYLIDDQTLLNRTAMSKFGVHVGDVTLAFRKR